MNVRCNMPGGSLIADLREAPKICGHIAAVT
jgi:hypothetical protein